MNAVTEQPVANPEAEAGLIGALFHENKLIDPIADKLSPEDFSDPFMGSVFAAIVEEASKGRNVTPVTLKPYFEIEYRTLAGLMGSGAEILAAKDCARQIKELSQRRKLIDGLSEVIAEAKDSRADIAELVSAGEAALADAHGLDERQTHISAGAAAKSVIEALNDRETGVSCHIAPIDAVLGPILPKQLAVLAGRPAMGKSAVASSMGLGAALHGHGVLFVSLEMSSDELAERLLSDLCYDSSVQIPYAAITDKRTTPEQARHLCRAMDKLESLPFEIADLSGITISRLNALVRRECRRFQAKGKKLELVIVDYLQLIRPDRQSDSRTHEITQVSMGLKEIAKEHNVGVLALAQLNRSVENRSDKRPIMADLRESGQIEQDADSIMFLFRAEYYLAQSEPQSHDAKHVEWEQAMEEHKGKIEFIVAKVRRRRTGTATGHFYGAYQAVRA